MAEIDIRQLTNEAEAGHGCAVKAQLQQVPFDESIKIMKQIEDQNTVNTKANPDIPSLSFYSGGNEIIAYAGLNTNGKYLWSSADKLVSDGLKLQETAGQKIGDRKFSCSDRK